MHFIERVGCYTDPVPFATLTRLEPHALVRVANTEGDYHRKVFKPLCSCGYIARGRGKVAIAYSAAVVECFLLEEERVIAID